MNSVITGTGKCLPTTILTNDELTRMVDTSDEWITRMTGIKERRIIDAGKTSVDLASSAALSALEASGLSAKKIDLIIVATISNEKRFGSCACDVQARIGASNACATDTGAGCTGFLSGLDTANAFIQSGKHKNALVIGVEVLSRITDYTDRGTCILFGDGAGAVILESSEGNHGILASRIFSDGSKGNLLYCEKTSDGKEFLRMDGNTVFKHAVRNMIKSSRLVMNEANLEMKDIGLLIPHQANERIIRTIAERIGIPPEKVFMNIAKYGNMSSATIPIAITEALEEDRIKTDDILLLTAFGAGLTWGSTIVRWGLGRY